MSLDGLRSLLKRSKEEKAQKQASMCDANLESLPISPSSSFPAPTCTTVKDENGVNRKNATGPIMNLRGSSLALPEKGGEEESSTGGGGTVRSDITGMEGPHPAGKRERCSSPFSTASSVAPHSTFLVQGKRPDSCAGGQMTDGVTGKGTPVALKGETEEGKKKNEDNEVSVKRKKEDQLTREEVNQFRKHAMKILERSLRELAKGWERCSGRDKRNRHIPVFLYSTCSTSTSDEEDNGKDGKKENHVKEGKEEEERKRKDEWSVISSPVCRYIEELLEVECRVPRAAWQETPRRTPTKEEEGIFIPSRRPSSSASTGILLYEEVTLLRALGGWVNAEESSTPKPTNAADAKGEMIPLLHGDVMQKQESKFHNEEEEEGEERCISCPIPVYEHCREWRRRASLLQCMWFLLAAQWRASLGGKGLATTASSLPRAGTTIAAPPGMGPSTTSPLLVVDSAGDRIEGWSYMVYRYLQLKASAIPPPILPSTAPPYGAAEVPLPISPSSPSASLCTASHMSLRKEEERSGVEFQDHPHEQCPAGDRADFSWQEVTSLPVRYAAEQWREESQWRQHAWKLLALVYHDMKRVEQALLRELQQQQREEEEVSLPPGPDDVPVHATEEGSEEYGMLPNTTGTSSTHSSTRTTPTRSTAKDFSHTSAAQESRKRKRLHLPAGDRLTQGCVLSTSLLNGLYQILVVNLQQQKLEAVEERSDGEEEEEEVESLREAFSLPVGTSVSSLFSSATPLRRTPHEGGLPSTRHSITALVTAARQAYNDVTLGNANWKLGLFSGGEVHMRRSMEKVERHRVHHLLNNEKALALLHVVHLWILFYEKRLTGKLRKWYCIE